MQAENKIQDYVFRALLLLSVGGPVAGCGKAKQPWEKVYPAKGVVNYQGKPLAGALITLVPQNETFPSTVRPTATSREDGTFALGTYSAADGAPAGEYKAIVLHYPVAGPKDSPHLGPNVLPKKYAKEETTDLEIKIDAGETKIPALNLK
jgi:hypothetical protein